MENKLVLEVQLATGIEISSVDARAWQSRLVTAGRGESWWGVLACHESMSKDSHQTFIVALS